MNTKTSSGKILTIVTSWFIWKKKMFVGRNLSKKRTKTRSGESDQVNFLRLSLPVFFFFFWNEKNGKYLNLPKNAHFIIVIRCRIIKFNVSITENGVLTKLYNHVKPSWHSILVNWWNNNDERTHSLVLPFTWSKCNTNIQEMNKTIIMWIRQGNAEAYLYLSGTSTMEFFPKIVNG